MLIHYKALSVCAAVAMTGLSVLVATPAIAKSQPVVVTAPRSDDLPTEHVGYQDLNLVLVADQAKLQNRVGSAVKRVCRISDYYAERSLTSFADYMDCSHFAWGGANPQISAAIDRAVALAQAGNGAAVGSVAISVTAPTGA
jgi:UrcA family protein